MRSTRATWLLALFLGGCCPLCGGSSDPPPTAHRIDAVGLTVTMPAHFRRQDDATGTTFTSEDGHTSLRVEAAAAGAPAAQRDPRERVPGAPVQWQRPVVIGAMNGVEARLTPTAQRADWVAAIDGPRGVVWIHQTLTIARAVEPTEWDLAWETNKGGVARTP